MPSYRIEIPNWRPPSLNSLLRQHWTKVRRLKAAAQAMVQGYWLAAGHPKATGQRRVVVTVVNKGQEIAADCDNLLKCLLDALVAAGALVDDSPQWLAGVEVRHERGSARATIIEVVDVDAN